MAAQIADEIKSELALPPWIQPHYFEDVLRRQHDNFKRISHFQALPALKPGENYASLVIRIAIEFETAACNDEAAAATTSSQRISLMLKVEHELMSDFLSKYDYFALESCLYNDLLPDFERMYAAAGHSIQLAPKAFAFGKAPPCRTVLMEDLRAAGYCNAKRQLGFDVPHTQCMLRKLAAFHAASVCRLALKGDFEPKELMLGFFSEASQAVMAETINGFISSFNKALKHYQGCEYLQPKVLKLLSGMFEHCIALHKLQPAYVQVLNHGDLWCNNIMFRCSEGQQLDALLIDFQTTTYFSPALDLYYVLMSSVSLQHKLDKFDQFIVYYHQQLLQHLQLLHYDRPLPQLQHLQQDLRTFGIFGFISCVAFLTVCLADGNDEAASFENYMYNNDFKLQMMSSERFCQHMVKMLPWMNQRGLLDI